MEIKKQPLHNYIRKFGKMKTLPDRLYYLLKDNFPNYGLLRRAVRPIRAPQFRSKEDHPGLRQKKFKSFKKAKKGMIFSGRTMKKRSRKALSGSFGLMKGL